MNILKSKNLTYLGTLRKNKREIPPEFQPNKSNQAAPYIGSSETNINIYYFLFIGQLTSIVPKKNCDIDFISTLYWMHRWKDQKPTMIVDYIYSKGGVYEIENKCSIYSCKARRVGGQWQYFIGS